MADKSTHYTQYHTASILCETLGAHLAVPRTEEEMQCVRRLADKLDRPEVWLGVDDDQEECRYEGLDGCGPVEVPHDWWAHQQPNGGDTENFMASTATGWFDSGSGNVKYPICQLSRCFKTHCL